MYQTLLLVNAALARVQPNLPSIAKVTADRLTFAAFPIMGYSLTSDKIPQTTLWELANYTLKPRMNCAEVVLWAGSASRTQIKDQRLNEFRTRRLPPHV